MACPQYCWQPVGARSPSHSQSSVISNVNTLLQMITAAKKLRIIITSRIAVTVKGKPVHALALGRLTEAAAMGLAQNLVRDLSKEHNRQLVTACEFNPLSIRLTCASIAYGSISLQVLLHILVTAGATGAAFNAYCPSLSTCVLER
jgi:hypothetical protein